MSDAVHSPAHYSSGGIECKDALRAAIGSGYVFKVEPDPNEYPRIEYENIPPIGFYWWGCAFKYLWRWNKKNGIEDLQKCKECIDLLINELEGVTND